MLCRLRNFFISKYVEIKNLIKNNKWMAISMLVCMLFGIVLSINKAKSLVDMYSDGNIITQIADGEFNFFLFYLKSMLFVTIVAVIAYLLTINLYVFLLNFPLVILYVKYFLGYIVVSCMLDGLTGYLLLFLVWLPIMIFNVFMLLMLIIRLFQIVDFPCDYKKLRRIVPYSSYWRYTKKILTKHILIANIITFCYLSITIIIISLLT